MANAVVDILLFGFTIFTAFTLYIDYRIITGSLSLLEARQLLFRDKGSKDGPE